MSGKEPVGQEEWLEMLRHCILFGILFKAAMWDLALIKQQPVKISYHLILAGLSRWAEREHHRIKRSLKEKGCELLTAKKQGSVYMVQYRQQGYYREAIYSIEVLRAECQQLVDGWAERHERSMTTIDKNQVTSV